MAFEKLISPTNILPSFVHSVFEDLKSLSPISVYFEVNIRRRFSPIVKKHLPQVPAGAGENTGEKKGMQSALKGQHTLSRGSEAIPW